MLTRIVTMTFQEEKVDEFIREFFNRKNKIESMPGCHSVKLLKDYRQNNIISTLSYWDSNEDLQHYRNSELFKETWSIVKPMFSENATAKSLVTIDNPE